MKEDDAVLTFRFGSMFYINICHNDNIIKLNNPSVSLTATFQKLGYTNCPLADLQSA